MPCCSIATTVHFRIVKTTTLTVKDVTMSDGLDERRKALEESYFEKENQEKLAELSKKGAGHRLSPVTGKPMVREVIHGVTIDRCEDSKGIWLDAGELEELVKVLGNKEKEEKEGWITTFFGRLITPESSK